MNHRLISFQRDATRFATRRPTSDSDKPTVDGHMVVDQVLQAGCVEAIRLIREGRYGYAEYRLSRALMKAARMLGEAEHAAELEQLRFFSLADRPLRDWEGGAR